MTSPPLSVSVMITTKNRSADLRRTCRMLRLLNPPPLEVLITADGCTDDTIPVVKSEMPEARLIVNAQGKGSIESRDRMIREAKGDLIFALDDDSYPEQLDCINRIVSLFEQNARLAILHFPQRTDEYPETLAKNDFGRERPTRSFANSGAVLRRSVYLQLPGFERRFFHQYEEPDYVLQCVAAGFENMFFPAVTIRHHYSSRMRNELRIHHQHSRNEFWSTVLRCPFPYVLGVLSWRLFSQFRFACKRGFRWAIREPIWWWQALAGLSYCLRNRRPVSWSSYKQWLSLGN